MSYCPLSFSLVLVDFFYHDGRDGKSQLKKKQEVSTEYVCFHFISSCFSYQTIRVVQEKISAGFDKHFSISFSSDYRRNESIQVHSSGFDRVISAFNHVQH